MQHLWLIPALPFAGFLINGIFGRTLLEGRWSTPIAIGSVLLSFAWVLKVVLALGDDANLRALLHLDHRAAISSVGWDFSVDRLTAVMLLIVTGIGSLIHIYAIGYMAHEGGYYRFFAYLNLFMFFMLTLVLAANYLVLVRRLGRRRPVQLSADRLLLPRRRARPTPATRPSS